MLLLFRKLRPIFRGVSNLPLPCQCSFSFLFLTFPLSILLFVLLFVLLFLANSFDVQLVSRERRELSWHSNNTDRRKNRTRRKKDKGEVSHLQPLQSFNARKGIGAPKFCFDLVIIFLFLLFFTKQWRKLQHILCQGFLYVCRIFYCLNLKKSSQSFTRERNFCWNWLWTSASIPLTFYINEDFTWF